MDIPIERNDGLLVATPSGRIDGFNAQDFHQTLTGAISGDDAAVLVDMGGLNYISSAGLRSILMIAKALWQRKAKFMLCSLSGSIAEVFKMSGFDKIIEIHDSKEDALATLGG
ncbi:MAG: STAS domain-containing protein [Gammaproteobacteria bacterium]|nr:STAS domain-containing protein [Gammaproteobacteria bacterium]MCY4165168.1 STAS domain-containing protein [Gammaproteobacteria bacterium]MCY4339844.1 STAS domain-containing protein [Gammaproteobacteria bacterium]